jgi:hypothetical protein
MAEHMRVDFHLEASGMAGSLHHRLKATRGEGRAALATNGEPPASRWAFR